MLNAIKDLNKELMKCNNNNEKFTTITTFMSFKLDKYDL